MKRLLSYLKPHKWVMTLATVLVLFIIAVELYRPEGSLLHGRKSHPR